MTIKIVDIPGYEGRYQVASNGKIYSLPNRYRQGKRELKQEITYSKKAKYRRVSLSKNGKVTRFLVHRLVGAAFIPNPENKPQINHINNDSEYNDASNLEWVTGKENMTHSAKQGRQIICRKIGCITASEKARQQTLKKLQQNLGDRLIDIQYVDVENRCRCFVTFQCDICGNIYTKRSDTPAIKRNGVCRECL